MLALAYLGIAQVIYKANREAYELLIVFFVENETLIRREP